MTDFARLPDDLPVPVDDGAADHLAGARLPPVALPATDGARVRLDAIGPGRTVVFAYPRTGVPGRPSPDGWDLIPGARGCTPQACGFRDLHGELTAAGTRVFGLSTQSTDEQREAASRLHLPFPLLSDHELTLADAAGLPTFRVEGARLLRRLTMILRSGRIEGVLYPVFPPDRSAERTLEWLRDHPLDGDEVHEAGSGRGDPPAR